jgi:hypothetical protein
MNEAQIKFLIKKMSQARDRAQLARNWPSRNDPLNTLAILYSELDTMIGFIESSREK